MNDELTNNNEVMETVEENITKVSTNWVKYGLVGMAAVAAGYVIGTKVIVPMVKKLKEKKKGKISDKVNITNDEFEVDEI